jgi:hypothetical protein
VAAVRQRDVAWRRCGSGDSVSGGGGSRLRDVGGSLAEARWRWQRRWRQRDSATAAAARRGGGVGARARAIDGVTATLRRRNV